MSEIISQLAQITNITKNRILSEKDPLWSAWLPSIPSSPELGWTEGDLLACSLPWVLLTGQIPSASNRYK